MYKRPSHPGKSIKLQPITWSIPPTRRIDSWDPNGLTGFLPLRVGDQDTIKKPTVSVYSLEQKKALIHFELSIDQALLGNLPLANQEFEKAMKLDHTPEQDSLIQNRFRAVENMVPASAESKAWLAEHRKMLD